MRGKPKTHAELLKEAEMDRNWRMSKPPVKSRCIGFRRRHYFGQFNYDYSKKCVFCGKTRQQVKEEQK